MTKNIYSSHFSTEAARYTCCLLVRVQSQIHGRFITHVPHDIPVIYLYQFILKPTENSADVSTERCNKVTGDLLKQWVFISFMQVCIFFFFFFWLVTGLKKRPFKEKGIFFLKYYPVKLCLLTEIL